MSLTDQYADYLSSFQASARTQIESLLREGNLGTLHSFSTREDHRGVWIDVGVEVRGADKLYRRSQLVVDATEHPPEDPATFAATLFSTNVVQEELEVPHLRQRWLQDG
ncbi:hypothetical protein ACIRLA_36540 [Streptomyces sp. NPDC102364]|uniref:hypothetical protein n=1 Tax=unclassified Streptomyces TaxID=2593676 RepID=UPI003800629F